MQASLPTVALCPPANEASYESQIFRHQTAHWKSGYALIEATIDFLMEVREKKRPYYRKADFKSMRTVFFDRLTQITVNSSALDG